jgi:glycosyltransferase involved in cell wall biosynthesis
VPGPKGDVVRVLVVHNDYVSSNPSGERAVVADDCANLRAAGIEVFTHIRSSDEISALPALRKAELLIRPAYSREDAGRLRGLLDAERIDLVHLHNPYPLISPYVVRVAHRAGVPVVQTVHNYRMSCVNGAFFRDGHACTDCSGLRIPVPAVRHGCYRESRAQSAVMAGTLAVHRSTWRLVDRFLPVTPFMVRHLREAGIPPDRITPKPNTVPDPGPPTEPGRGLLFAGRLVAEKGVRLLLAAWERGGGSLGRLVLVGDGPLRPEVADAARSVPGVTYLGPVPPERVDALMREAAVVAVPSLWFEGFPMTVLEAFARGRPVLATALGSVGTVVDDEVGWRSGTTVEELEAVLRDIDPADVGARGAAARRRYESRYAQPVVTAALIDIYNDVVARREAARG